MRAPRLGTSAPRAYAALLIIVAALWATGAPGALTAGRPSSPTTAADFWLAPPRAATGESWEPILADLKAGRTVRTLTVFRPLESDPVLGGYARLYVGRAELAADHPAQALQAAQTLLASSSSGHLARAALLLAADADAASGNPAGAVRSLQALIELKPLDPEKVYLELGRAALGAADRALAADAWRTVYYDYPLTGEADDAAAMLVKLAAGALDPTYDTAARDLARAERLFAAKRYTDAHKSFATLKAFTGGDVRTLVDLRTAQCDAGLKHTTAATEALKALMDKASPYQTEARYAYLGTVRDLGQHDEYIALVRAFVASNTGDPLAEAALYDLATFFVRQDRDAEAAAAYADLYAAFPTGAHAERAAWQSGWWAFKNADYATTVRVFESAAEGLRHADFRPAWLYWIGRAHARLGEREEAIVAYHRVIADYRNTYYGREAKRELDALHTTTILATAAATTSSDGVTFAPGEAPANARLIQALLAVGAYDDALAELREVQRDRGTTPAIEATIAYTLNRQGELRSAITVMRRAYPQFMAEGGEALPTDLLAVIFPVQYWDLIEKYALLHKLDPCLIAALIAQESTFDAGVRSVANAWGLMQLLPSTGREYAQKLGIRPFRTARLTEPETNIRIGTAMFADMLHQFGDVAVALAAYNAGEDRAARWQAARPGIDRDEFIDDIPYTETQNYVKRILGTAEDYRLLYETGRAAPLTVRRH